MIVILVIFVLISAGLIFIILKTSKGKIIQNDNLRYVDGNMGNTGMPSDPIDNEYIAPISAPLKPNEPVKK